MLEKGQWDYLRQEFVKLLRAEQLWMSHSTYNNRIPANGKELQFLSNYYLDCRMRYEIEYDFEEFARKIYTVTQPYRIWRRRVKAERSSYIRNPNHGKKVLNEHQEARLAWREHKQVRKDKSKRHEHFSYNDYFRDENNKAHRRWVKAALKKGDWNLEKKWKPYAHYRTEWTW